MSVMEVTTFQQKIAINEEGVQVFVVGFECFEKDIFCSVVSLALFEELRGGRKINLRIKTSRNKKCNTFP